MRLIIFTVMTAGAVGPSAFGQQPTIRAIQNAASAVGPPIAPQMLISIYGQSLGAQPVSASSVPLPLQLVGTSVSINGIAAPLLYVSPGQINAQVPTGVRNSQPANITVTTAGGVSAPFLAPISQFSAPGFFTQDSSGCGQAAAMNIHANGSMSVNTPQNSFDPLSDSGVAFFLTGFGTFPDRVDGVPWQFNVNDNSSGGFHLIIGNPEVSDVGLPLSVTYAGPAPGTVGGDQLNATYARGYNYSSLERCRTPVWLFASGGSASQLVNISIHPGGGSCSDPVPDSLGMINWHQDVTSDSTGKSTSRSVTAQFLAAPGLVFPPQNLGLSNDRPQPTFCMASYPASLNAGSIIVAGSGVEATPLDPKISNGVLTYETVLPSGGDFGGTYMATGGGGQDIGPFSATASIPGPVNLTTSFPPGSQQSIYGGRLEWTGGDARSSIFVKMVFHFTDGSVVIAPNVESAADGSLVFIPIGSPPSPPPSGTEVEIIVIQYPSTTPSESFAAPGLTLRGEQNWRYVWDFRGLVSP